MSHHSNCAPLSLLKSNFSVISTVMMLMSSVKLMIFPPDTSCVLYGSFFWGI